MSLFHVQSIVHGESNGRTRASVYIACFFHTVECEEGSKAVRQGGESRYQPSDRDPFLGTRFI